MVFSSVPLYLDPHNWQQQPNHQQGIDTQNRQLLPPVVLPLPAGHHAGGDAVSIRAGSMADQARLAKIAEPETAPKCPRCESTNTKFCYFNNYSRSQPRHFCKTCRRYWTRGGALRNVPVGGGCRRNKKNKSNRRNKSPAAADKQTGPNFSSATPSSGCAPDQIIGHFSQQSPHQLPFLTTLQNLTRYGMGNLGLNLSEIQAHETDLGYQIGSSSGASNAILSSTGGVDHHEWRLQQFPFMGGFESQTGNLFSIQSEGVESPSPLAGDTELRTMTSSSRVSQLPPALKMEDQRHGQNLSADLNWGSGNAWTDLSGLHSSSTAHLL